ncbi:MAG: hypothetical protein M1401_11945 [Chloroflexi bacterium]|nr:hypothetical protein [Chloroflexota bacterium]
MINRRSIEDSLALAIDAVRAGRSTIDVELAGNPELGEQKDLLCLGAAIHAPAGAVLTPAVRRQMRAMLIEEARAKGVTNHRLGRIFWLKNPFNQRRANMPAILSLVFAVCLTLGGGGLYAAQAAAPGDALFPLKAGLEQAQVAWAQGDEALIGTHLGLAERRLDEIEAHHNQLNHEAERGLGANALTHLDLAAQAIERFAAAGHDAGEYQARLAADQARYEAWQQRFGQFDPGGEHQQGVAPTQQHEQEGLNEQEGMHEQDRTHSGDGEHSASPIRTPEPEHEGAQQGEPQATHEPEMEQHEGTPAPSHEPEHDSTVPDGQGPAPLHEPEP